MNNSESVQEKQPKKTSRFTAYLLFGVGGIPIILAFFMYFSGTMIPQARTNHGTFILPPMDMSTWGLTAELESVSEDKDSKWQLIVVGEGECAKQCQESLYNIRQVNTALGREAKRVEHSYIELNQSLNSDLQQLIRKEHPNMKVFFADKNSVVSDVTEKLNDSAGLNKNYIFIADPLGNVMMYYTPKNVGRDILDDMKRLLKVSKIG